MSMALAGGAAAAGFSGAARAASACAVASAAGGGAASAADGVVNKIYSNSLEASNVDMASQFVRLIQTQQAYTANSKTITTADEMTDVVLNLIR